MAWFDAIQDRMFDTVTKVFGYTGSWTPSTGGAAIEHPCLIKEPTDEYDANGVKYTPFDCVLEWRSGHFPGLFEAVRGKKNERVTVRGVTYYVRNVQASYDGRTLRADLEKIIA